MANPGAIGAKFVSVNLNKSYGQSSSHHNHHHPPYSGSYGAAAVGRAQPNSSGGGGMVVLSRARGPQKVVPKLSVPPPLNLPSLRKEHEKHDFSGSGSGGSATGGGSGSGLRSTSSGMGWTKPATIALVEKDGGDTQVVDAMDQNMKAIEGVSRGNSCYMPPSARSGGVGLTINASARAYPPLAEKAAVLRGEDFPSLQAAMPIPSGNVQKQKDTSHQKQKQVVGEELLNEQMDNFHSSTVHMHQQRQSSHHTFGNGSGEHKGEGYGQSSSCRADKKLKQEDFFPSPLPIVRLNPRSDWADDERDTGHGFADRGRDYGFPKSETYLDRDFDMPRSSVLPHKPVHNQNRRWGQRDDDTGKVFSSEVVKVGPYRRDGRTVSREGREGNMWRTSPVPKDVFCVQDIVNDRNNFGERPTALHRDTGRPPHFEDNAGDGGATGYRDLAFRRRDLGHVAEGRQQLNHTTESLNNQGAVRNARDRHHAEQSNRYNSDAFQNSTVSKTSIYSYGKGLPMNDAILNFGREKRTISKSERPYVEDPFLKDLTSTDFGDTDPFYGGLVGVVKRKKDVAKQADFHDPIRESFEAELERVQKMQELERQHIIEEQERALELARKEEEERQRLIREGEEHRRRVEEEAREAAWRAEQENLESIRRAEEQKIAREEERRMTLMEEERRKQAAKQKLLELEARIAQRQAESAKSDRLVDAVANEKLSAVLKEKDISRGVDLDNWEDSERMVDRISISGSSGSAIPNRTFEMGSRPHPSREGSSTFLDGGKPGTSWRGDVFQNGNSPSILVQDYDIDLHSPRRDTSVGGRAFPSKEFYGGAAYMPSRTFFKGGMQEPLMDEYAHLKEQKWNHSGDGDLYSKTREIDSEFLENFAERYGDIGWGGQGHSHGYPRSPYPGRFYPNTEGDEIYPYGRSRNSMRQPRVLPPPSLASMHKTSFRGENERPGPSTFLDDDLSHNHTARSGSTMQTGYYSGHPERLEPSALVNTQEDNAVSEEEQNQDSDTTPRCDSQSSVSVSSPPASPPHLSHDELDEAGDSPVVPAREEGKKIPLSGTENTILNDKSVKDTMMIASSSSSADEDEGWPLENKEESLEQEEYDEDDDGYQEEDEVREGDYDNIDLTQEFDNMHVQGKDSSHMMDNLVLGFDEGVEVGIPSDDYVRIPRNEESTFGIPEVSDRMGEEQESVDGLPGDEHSFQPGDGSLHLNVDGSSQRIQETEKEMQESIIHPIIAPHTSIVSDLLDSVDASSTSDLSHQQTLPSMVGMPLHSSAQTSMSTLSSVPSQADFPKVQFGLFSGPSLISSPVPSIQIGSIQMPLHLHPPVGPSLTHHIHSSQPPLFHFGQLRYTSPITQGLLPMAPQSVSLFQPNVQAHYNLNQSSVGSLPVQPGRDTFAQNVLKHDVPSLLANNQPVVVLRPQDSPNQNGPRGLNSLSVRESTECNGMIHKSRTVISATDNNKAMLGSGSQSEDTRHHDTVVNIDKPSNKERGLESQSRSIPATSVSGTSETSFSGSVVQGALSSSKGRRFAHSVRNSVLRSTFPASEVSSSDSSGFQSRHRPTIQRTEFRVWETVDRRQSLDKVSSNKLGSDNSKSNFNGRSMETSTRSGYKRSTMSMKSVKSVVEMESSSSGPTISQNVDSESRACIENRNGKETLTKSQNLLRSGEGNLKRNVYDEDVDAPLQSGIVRVFKQPGIETPSDEDDFIEVRSKRQMLNDRREQREKDIKAKSRVPKPPLRPRLIPSPVVSAISNKISGSLGGEASKDTRTDFVVSGVQGLPNKEESTGFTTVVSQTLAPIGIPAVNTDSQADLRSHTTKSLQTSPVSVVSGGGNGRGPGIIFETTLDSWGKAQLNQQVVALTQTRFDTHVTAFGGHTKSVSEPILPSSSILTKDRSFSSTSPVNSLLAGEKIQFGAVTSPTVLPPNSRPVTHGIGAPGSSRSDIQGSRNLSSAETDCTIFFEKDEHHNKSCVHLDDCESEAEAAASAVAVAAISSDDTVGNGLGSVCISDTKSFGGLDIDGITEGVASDQQVGSQLRADESLSVSLPADLSVDTPPISLWPPLPSAQNSSSQMLSHFPPGPPSHFPFYEMNSMLGGPIFAFGPPEDSAGTQTQSQKSTASGSTSHGTWQQCHSTVDSFYGPPTGFTGPFISPPPGVQGPPHMVVYNHFAPLSQFGQVGLSFMGTTYIPSGKPTDWRHNPMSSANGIHESSMNHMKAIAQHNPPNLPAPVQHLAPGSPLLPMASPLARFDASPFQSAPDISVQARWSQVPASALHPVPLPLPPPSQFSHGHPVDQSLATHRFLESRTSTPSDNDRSFPLSTDATKTPFPDELGLLDTSRSASAKPPTIAINKSSSASVVSDSCKSDDIQNGSSSNINSEGQSTNAFHMQQPSRQKTSSAQQQYSQSTGYNYQRGGGMSYMNNSGGEWSHRRMGFHGRNQSLGAEKGFPPPKMKQIYVAKQNSTGNSKEG